MVTLTGKSVFRGIAIGRLAFFNRGTSNVERISIPDADAEIQRFEAARNEAKQELSHLYEKARQEAGEESAMIFEIHQMMLDDLDFVESVTQIIQDEKINAKYAVSQTAEQFSAMFAAMDDSYMRARAADVKDIAKLLMNILSNEGRTNFSWDEPVILCADDLAPSETVQLDKSKVLAFLTQNGSTNSHTAILSRTMGIPAIVSMGMLLDEQYDGCIAAVDGITSTVYIDPDEPTLAAMRIKQAEDLAKRELLKELVGQENVTIDGKKIELYANIGNISDLDLALQNDAGGIGLFRSEFLYLENNDFPTEEEQFAIYKEAAEKMKGKLVIIRTLDIGADKKIGYFHLPEEENPALGYRAIRICLDRPDIFKTQLRALCRASAFGNIAIMFPMIISVEEIIKIKEILKEVQSELETKNIAYNPNMQIGIMIETPAAVILSDLLAQEVDFFSVGTNDLAQYTLAIDRQNQKLEPFFNPHHKALLRMLKIAADNAHAHGKWIGICGELGADTALTEVFLALGIDELSVSPSAILNVRKKVRQVNVTQTASQALANYL